MEPRFAEELRNINLKEFIPVLTNQMGVYCAEDLEHHTDEQLQKTGFTLVQCFLIRQAAEDVHRTKEKPLKKPQKIKESTKAPLPKKKVAATSAAVKDNAEEDSKESIKVDWAKFPKRSIHQIVSRGSAAACFGTSRSLFDLWTARSTDIPWMRASNAERAGVLIASGKSAVRCGGPDLPQEGPSFKEGSNRVAMLDSISSALKESKGIRHLDLGCYNLGGPAGRSFAEALQANHSLWHLDLAGCALGAEIGRAVAEVLEKNRTILHLNLRENALGSGEGAVAIAKVVKKNQYLKHLDLSHNQLGPEGGCIIAKALGLNKSLTHLNLSYNALGSQGCVALAESLGLGNKRTTVQYLDLRHNDIKTEGIQAITKAIRNNPSFTLREIQLAGNALRIQDATAVSGALRLNKTLFHRPSPYYD